jgi:hypothetical protein
MHNIKGLYEYGGKVLGTLADVEFVLGLSFHCVGVEVLPTFWSICCLHLQGTEP